MNKHTLRPMNLAFTAALLAGASAASHAATFSAPFTSAMVDKMVAGSLVAAGGADTNKVLLAGPSGTTGPLNLVKATAWGSGSDTNASTFAKVALTDQGVGLGAGPGTSPKHAIDNSGTREFVLFEFDQAVTLNSLSLSWISTDSDLSIAAFTGAGDAEALLAGGTINSTNTGNNLAGSNWKSLNVAGTSSSYSQNFNYFETAGAGGSAVASKFWLVGAYNSGLGNTFTTANDYVKLSGLGGKYTTPCYPPGSPGCTPGGGGGGSVPEPSSITLAALGLFGGIRRWKSRQA